MTEKKANPIFHLMPSLTDVAFLLPLVFLFGGLNGAHTLIGDGDTGWHIRSGDWMLAHGQVPSQDMFSFTKPGQPWFAWEWLWDVCFALIHKSWGLGGVVFASMMVICLTAGLLYKLLLRITVKEGLGNPLVAIVLTGMALGGASVHWLARPHLFSMLFVVLFMMVLEAAREQEGASGQGPAAREEIRAARERNAGSGWRLASGVWPLVLLPLLTILWTNLHGGFFIGIIIVGTYAAGPLVRAAIERNGAERAKYAKSSLKYIAATAACALASLVNPYTYHLHVHIYQYLLDPFALNNIGEFQPTNFRWGPSGYLEVMMVLALFTAIWYARRKQFTEVLLIAGWGHLALVVARNVPIFMIVAAPLVARPLVHWLRAAAEAPVAGWLRSALTNLEEIGQEMAAMERPWRLHLFSAAAVLVVAAGMGSPEIMGAKFKAEYDPKKYPAAALGELGNPTARIFTQEDWGGFLIYKLAPQGTKVYVDGRSDFYGDKFGEEFLTVMNVKYDWEKTLARYGVDTILLPVDSALAGAIKLSPHWRVRYDDGHAVVFRPAESAGGANSQVSAGSISRGGDVRSLPAAAFEYVPTRAHVIEASQTKLKREGVIP